MRRIYCDVTLYSEGVRTGYQKWMIDTWEKKSVEVLVSKYDVADYGETESLLNQASSLAPIGGIFHLAAVSYLMVV